MIESLFYFLVLAAGVVAAFGFSRRQAAFIGLGGVLFLVCSLLLLGGGNQGIEKDNGQFVRYVGDHNYNIDYNVSYLNANNDSSLFALAWVFFGGGFALVLFGIVATVKQRSGA
jgi:hypothetical protein